MQALTLRRSRNVRRALGMLGVLGLALVAATPAIYADGTGTQVAAKPAGIRLQSPPREQSATALEQTVFGMVNRIRQEKGVAPVRLATDLQQVARAHSDYQARANALTHRGADGRCASERLDAAKIAWLRYGENVGLVKGYSDPARTVVDAWLSSPGHAANLLNPELAEAAVGVAQAADGTYFLTQVFVTR